LETEIISFNKLDEKSKKNYYDHITGDFTYSDVKNRISFGQSNRSVDADSSNLIIWRSSNLTAQVLKTQKARILPDFSKN
jgi:hypothetical protein